MSASASVPRLAAAPGALLSEMVSDSVVAVSSWSMWTCPKTCPLPPSNAGPSPSLRRGDGTACMPSAMRAFRSPTISCSSSSSSTFAFAELELASGALPSARTSRLGLALGVVLPLDGSPPSRVVVDFGDGAGDSPTPPARNAAFSSSSYTGPSLKHTARSPSKPQKFLSLAEHAFTSSAAVMAADVGPNQEPTSFPKDTFPTRQKACSPNGASGRS
mmetsp:Transcript_17115/g.42498  ORF Transcript_17115/g.42498 Transcript_17115/m.42498 type:complete len:217 (+) Transcript_17115:280-930(+)